MGRKAGHSIQLSEGVNEALVRRVARARVRVHGPSSLGLRGSGYAAMDHNGQAVAVIPSKRLVVVQTADRHDSLVELRSAHFIELLHLIVAATSSAMP